MDESKTGPAPEEVPRAGARDPRRDVPSVGSILQTSAASDLVALYGATAVTIQARHETEALRRRLAEGTATPGDGPEACTSELLDRLARTLESRFRGLRRVLNATGIVVHTNLGRSPLPKEVAAETLPLLDAYCDLELDLETGERADRNRGLGEMLAVATGAEDALVVNNNAGALVLALATLAHGREVLVSRGELVEIGGSFRIPEILEAAGCRLVEVGTTNRTRLDDYARAVGPETALVLKVEPSNYRIRGFTAAATVEELGALTRDHGLPLVYDEGSGLLAPAEGFPLADHPSMRELLEAGCDLVCGSGDKLLGGPQAGLLVGGRVLVARCRRHPLYRALRADRFTHAALRAVLRRRLAGRPMPLDGLWPDPDAHRRRLEDLLAALGTPWRDRGRIETADGFVGGGSAPDAAVPGPVLTLPTDATLLHRLRTGEPAVVAYVREGRLHVDLRTVDPTDDEALATALRNALSGPEADLRA